MTRYFNTTNGPVTYSGKGQSFGAGEWLTTEETPELKRAIENGWVVEVEDPEPEKTSHRSSRAKKSA